MILDRIVSVSHLTKDTDDADKEQYRVDEGLRAVAINIQPATAEETAITGGTYGRTFTAFTTASGLRTGDKITVSGTSQTFRVAGVGDWSNPDLISHYEYTFTEFQEDEVY